MQCRISSVSLAQLHRYPPKWLQGPAISQCLKSILANATKLTPTLPHIGNLCKLKRNWNGFQPQCLPIQLLFIVYVL